MRLTIIKLCTVIIASTLILNTEQLRMLSAQSTLAAESTANNKGLANAGTRIANKSSTQRAKELLSKMTVEEKSVSSTWSPQSAWDPE